MQESMSAFHWFILVLAAGIWAGENTEMILANEGEKKRVAVDSDKKRIRHARRKAMRQFADSFQVFRKTDDGNQLCKLYDHCVLYFTDSVHHPEIGEGTTWIWHDNGLPQAIAQVYQWEPKYRPKYNWRMGFYSFSSGRLIFGDGQKITREIRKTDFRPQDIPGAPLPATTKVARSRQMKQLSRRFDAHEVPVVRADPKRTPRPLRLLSTPIFRYAEKSSGVLDGAVFAFVHGGTNAQIVMLIEARLRGDKSARWTAGFGRLNSGHNHVQLDGREFWDEEDPGRPLGDHPSNYIDKVVPWTVESRQP